MFIHPFTDDVAYKSYCWALRTTQQLINKVQVSSQALWQVQRKPSRSKVSTFEKYKRIFAAQCHFLGRGHTILTSCEAAHTHIVTSRYLMWDFGARQSGEITFQSYRFQCSRRHNQYVFLQTTNLQRLKSNRHVGQVVTSHEMCATTEMWEACWHVRSRNVSRVTEVWKCVI